MIHFNWLLVGLLFWSGVTQAQHPYYYEINADTELPSHEVYEVTQDAFGYIWIGCDAGLYRYDGVSFVRFRNSEERSRSISHFRTDHRGRLWCQNFSAQLFYLENDSLHLFKDFKDKVQMFPVYDVDESRGRVWVTLQDRVEGYDMDTRELVATYPFEAQDNDMPPTRMAVQDGNIWAEVGGVYHRAEGAEDWEALPSFIDGMAGRFYWVGDRLLASQQYNRKSTREFYEWRNGRFELLASFPRAKLGEYIFMVKPVKNHIAVCTSSGVFLMDRDMKAIQQVLLPDEKISDILEDREGNLWITSLQSGVFVIPSLELECFDQTFFPGGNITSLGRKGNELVIGTYTGEVSLYNPVTGRQRSLSRNKKGNYWAVKDFMDWGDRWYVSRGQLAWYDAQLNEHPLPYANIRSLDRLGDTLFMAEPHAVFFVTADRQHHTIAAKSGHVVVTDTATHTAYFGTIDGFFKYQNGQVDSITYRGKMIVPVSLDRQGDTLWLGVSGIGVLGYSQGRWVGALKHGASLPGTSVRKVLVYGDLLLIATDVGLVIWAPRTGTMRIIDATDGLQQREINGIVVMDGMVYLGTTRGLVRFPVWLSPRNIVQPNLRLLGLSADGTPISLSANPRFAHDVLNLSFRFGTALMRSRGRFVYEYRLLGQDSMWRVTPSGIPYVNYTALRPGQYTFEVRSVNEDGIKSEVSRYPFWVNRPIWQRLWFQLLVLASVAIAVYSLTQWRIRGIRRKAQIENELKTSQLTAIKAQINPHFLYNALNSIQELILLKDIKGASRYLSKFSLLMRQVLEGSGHTSLALEAEVELIRLYLELEKLRFGDEVAYELTLPAGEEWRELQVPSMIIQPFVENAIKHGLLHKTDGQKRLSIRFEVGSNVLCTIEDNGIGRKHSAEIKARRGVQVKSFATSATQKRLEILNQVHQNKIGLEIEDLYENGVARGTRVKLYIPIL